MMGKNSQVNLHWITFGSNTWLRTAIHWAGNVVGKEDQMEERKCLEKEMAKRKPKQIPRETRSAEESK